MTILMFAVYEISWPGPATEFVTCTGINPESPPLEFAATYLDIVKSRYPDALGVRLAVCMTRAWPGGKWEVCA